jgi:hypothetical protein
MQRSKFALPICFFFLVLVLVGGCGAKSSVVGRWQFQRVNGSWDYDWIEFFKDGGCTDSWGNSRTWTMTSPNRLKLVAGFGAGTYLYEVKITGDKMVITDEYGNSAMGTRLSGASSSRDAPGWLLWVVLILLAAGAVAAYLVYRRGRRRTTGPDYTAPKARSPSPSFCMHCGQPVQAGSKFCLHCGKALS